MQTRPDVRYEQNAVLCIGALVCAQNKMQFCAIGALVRAHDKRNRRQQTLVRSAGV